MVVLQNHLNHISLLVVLPKRRYAEQNWNTTVSINYKAVLFIRYQHKCFYPPDMQASLHCLHIKGFSSLCFILYVLSRSLSLSTLQLNLFCAWSFTHENIRSALTEPLSMMFMMIMILIKYAYVQCRIYLFQCSAMHRCCNDSLFNL